MYCSNKILCSYNEEQMKAIVKETIIRKFEEALDENRGNPFLITNSMIKEMVRDIEKDKKEKLYNKIVEETVKSLLPYSKQLLRKHIIMKQILEEQDGIFKSGHTVSDDGGQKSIEEGTETIGQDNV